MIAHRTSSLFRNDPVWVISPSVVLSVAVAAGLRTIGWTGACVSMDTPARPRGSRHGIVLVADEHNELPAMTAPSHAAKISVVAIASPAAGRSLLAALEHGVCLVNADQP